MKRYGAGLGLEIVKAVNSGLIEEPITFEKVKHFCEKHNLDPTENQMRVTLSNATDNEHSPGYIKYFERISRGRYLIRNEYRKNVGYYMLHAGSDSSGAGFTQMEIGDTQVYSSVEKDGSSRKKKRCFQSIKTGDLAIVYEAGRIKSFTALCKVVKKYQANGAIYVQFAKQHHFIQPLALEKVKQTGMLPSGKKISSPRSTLLEMPREDFHFLIEEWRKVNSVDEYYADLEREVAKARKDSREERKKRLRKRKQLQPEKIEQTITIYKKNPDVIAEVLERANGICENCGNPAPFIRFSDGSPYLEIHHHFQLADGGEDTVENAIAVCPNCHRELHYGGKE